MKTQRDTPGDKELPQMLTSKQVMETLNISRATLNRMITRGDLTVYKFGASLRFKEEDIRAFIEAHEMRSSK